MLTSDQRQGMELREQGRRLVIVGTAQIVDRMAMLHRGRTPRQDVGIPLEDCVGVLALHPIHERAKPVHVVEVLEEPEAIHRCEVFVRLLERERGCHLDRHLLETDRRLERCLIRRQ